MNDGELLRRYQTTGDEQAFGELVKRHLNLVHATAARRVGDPHAAADICQSVFCLLLRKGPTLVAMEDLAGWLHRATCFKAAEWSRSERRRRFHEQKAATMHDDSSPDTATWSEIAPLLDGALNELPEPDRQYVLLRFFRQVSFRDLGQRFGVSEDAARMRVNRALERLRSQLAQAGASVGPSVLGAWLEQHAAPPAPAALHGMVISAVRSIRLEPHPASLPDRAASRFGARRNALLLGAAVLATIGSLAFWSYSLSPLKNQAAPGPELGADNGHPSGTSSVVRSPVIEPAPASRPVQTALLDDLRRILHSTVQDSSWPPSDLRRSIAALADYPEETLAVLRDVLGETSAAQMARERAIWGLWLLGEKAPTLVPVIVDELVGVLRSSDRAPYWWHSAEVLLHLGTPEICLQGVASAVQQNPAAAQATLRLWERALARYPELTKTLLSPWLAETDARPFVAATALAGEPDHGKVAIPILAAALDDPSRRDQALSAIKRLGPAVHELAPELKERLHAVEGKGQTWLQRQLVETLAAVDPASRADFAEVDQLLRAQEEAATLRRKMQDNSATISDLAGGLLNREVSWQAALDLQELGPAAEAALPALRAALAERDNPHRYYFAEAIKAIEPWAPRPIYGRDELMSALRALSDSVADLGAELTDGQRADISSYVQEAGEHTPQELALRARELARLHPRLRDAFVSGLLATDPMLERELTP